MNQTKRFLHQLLADIAHCEENLLVTGLALDSRQIKQGMVFFAVAGHQQHGLIYAQQVIDKGAVAIIYEADMEGATLALNLTSLPLIPLQNLAHYMGIIARRFYQNPNQYLDLIAITGTNGKTSCSLFLSQAMQDYGVIGTLGWGSWNQLQNTENTTPDALSLQAMLTSLQQSKKTAVAIEVSSHALVQQRVNALRFKGVLFTNISRDHLDYHQTMPAYVASKLSLLDFDGLEFCVVNLDDNYSAEILANTPESIQCWGYSRLNHTANTAELVQATDVKQSPQGTELTVKWRQQQATLHCSLFGDFNIENILAVLSCLLAMGIDFSVATQKITLLTAISGRMEHFGGQQHLPAVFVDYAHTPDALACVLKTLRKHCSQTLWLVFGCGGNRDQGKRALMGKVAKQWADKIIIADDNPRDEDPSMIVNDILSGDYSQDIQIIHQRDKAIAFAISHAKLNDIVLIAGKGHEDYQEINGVLTPFCDRQIVKQCLKDYDVIK